MNKQQRGNHLIKAAGFLLLLGWLGTAMALLPQSISYQGYLTNTDGTPVDTTTNITFRLYNVDAGGVPLWENTLSVPVEKGFFSVELGAASPFPLGLFDDPLWLGIEVGADGEMTSRKALTSVGFAFRAERVEIDEDTLANLGCTADQVAKWDSGASAWICADDLSGGSTDWASLTGVPAGFADNIDNDTLTSQICQVSEVLKSDGSGGWLCSADDNSGDITAVTAGAGLMGGASSGDVDLTANFAGSGAASTVARSDHNHAADLANLQGQINDLQSQINALQDKLEKVSVSTDGNQIYITDANLHIVSGSGATEWPGNGRGNLIVGYNELRNVNSPKSCSLGEATTQEECDAIDAVWAVNHKRGSHNIVVGAYHNYSRYGGIVVGDANTISGEYASVSGGVNNIASGDAASVSGGESNTASGPYASVSGGQGNKASGGLASVSGGQRNTASGVWSSVAGGGGFEAGDGNEAFASLSVILGGRGNLAGDPAKTDHIIGKNATVSGGYLNWASGYDASVSGGQHNHAFADLSAILGGKYNTTGDTASGNHAIGETSTVSGGDSNTAKGLTSMVSGGVANIAGGYRSAISGGLANATSAEGSTVSGGASNSATGRFSVVGGGQSDQAATDYSWCAAGLGTCAP